MSLDYIFLSMADEIDASTEPLDEGRFTAKLGLGGNCSEIAVDAGAIRSLKERAVQEAAAEEELQVDRQLVAAIGR